MRSASGGCQCTTTKLPTFACGTARRHLLPPPPPLPSRGAVRVCQRNSRANLRPARQSTAALARAEPEVDKKVAQAAHARAWPAAWRQRWRRLAPRAPKAGAPPRHRRAPRRHPRPHRSGTSPRLARQAPWAAGLVEGRRRRRRRRRQRQRPAVSILCIPTPTGRCSTVTPDHPRCRHLL